MDRAVEPIDEAWCMKILHAVEFYSPSVGGSQEVIKQISERLVKRGHQVTVATGRLPERRQPEINGVKVVEFSLSGNAVRGIKGETERYQRFIMDGDFDVMLNYSAQQWATDLVFPLLERLRFPAILAPCGFSYLYTPAYAAYYRKLPEILRRFSHLVLHSNSYRDAQFIRQAQLSNVTVIPNGAAQEEFDRIDPTFRARYHIPDGPLLLTVGSHTGVKGHRLVIDAFRKAHIGRACLVIIGNTLGRHGCWWDCQARALWTSLASRGKKVVRLLNPPRQDVVSAYHAGDLFVFGSNIECSPLVLFEAMASKTPFLSLACGNAAEIAERGQGGVIVPTIQNLDGTVDTDSGIFSNALEDLWRDQPKREQMAQSGYAVWREHFTWEPIVSQYEQLYSGVIGSFRK
jgi:glycosyltransferase involved in cell wall biosynthesis